MLQPTTINDEYERTDQTEFNRPNGSRRPDVRVSVHRHRFDATPAADRAGTDAESAETFPAFFAEALNESWGNTCELAPAGGTRRQIAPCPVVAATMPARLRGGLVQRLHFATRAVSPDGAFGPARGFH